MHINTDSSTYKPPYTVIILDAMDAYYYADIMEHMEIYCTQVDVGKAIALADALFVIKNSGWKSLSGMNSVDGGYDVRVYDSQMSCVYAAHTKYTETWIGSAPTQHVFTTKIHDAIQFALETHEVCQKQKRKGKDIPYITHPLTVGVILARAGASEDVVCAGILHDTIEDSVPEHKVTRDMLAQRFGAIVADLVDSVTEQDKSAAWDARKAAALEHIKTFSHDALLVKSADILANGTELLADYATEGEAVFDRFNAGKAKILHHYQQAISHIITTWPHNLLAHNLHTLTHDLSTIS